MKHAWWLWLHLLLCFNEVLGQYLYSRGVLRVLKGSYGANSGLDRPESLIEGALVQTGS